MLKGKKKSSMEPQTRDLDLSRSAGRAFVGASIGIKTKALQYTTPPNSRTTGHNTLRTLWLSGTMII